MQDPIRYNTMAKKNKNDYMYIPSTEDDDDNKKKKRYYVDGGVVVSRYMRPSMSSCHDFCKYGEERALEIKARTPNFVSKNKNHHPSSKRKQITSSKQARDRERRTDQVVFQKNISPLDVILKHGSDQNVVMPIDGDVVVNEEALSFNEIEATSSDQITADVIVEDVLSRQDTTNDLADALGSLKPRPTEVVQKQKRISSSSIKAAESKVGVVSRPLVRKPATIRTATVAERRVVVNRKVIRKLKSERSISAPAIDLISKRKSLRPLKRRLDTKASSSSHLKRNMRPTPSKEVVASPEKAITPALALGKGSRVAVALTGESDPVRKLKFRRGKVIEIQQEDMTPRRLKFKPRVVIPDPIEAAVAVDGRISRRRRRSEENKDSKNLCNNVIEETVSELVKTRASKVKALVGAFETLQTMW